MAEDFARCATAFDGLNPAHSAVEMAQPAVEMASFAKKTAKMARIAEKVAPFAEDLALFDDCPARFECTVAQTHDAGDHLIIVGRVDQAALREGDALVFCMGRFGRFPDA